MLSTTLYEQQTAPWIFMRKSAHAKPKAQISLAVKLISTFVFTTRIVLYFLHQKFPASSHLLCLYSSVCVGPVRKPHCWFSHDVSCYRLPDTCRELTVERHLQLMLCCFAGIFRNPPLASSQQTTGRKHRT